MGEIMGLVLGYNQTHESQLAIDFEHEHNLKLILIEDMWGANKKTVIGMGSDENILKSIKSFLNGN